MKFCSREIMRVRVSRSSATFDVSDHSHDFEPAYQDHTTNFLHVLNRGRFATEGIQPERRKLVGSEVGAKRYPCFQLRAISPRVRVRARTVGGFE